MNIVLRVIQFIVYSNILVAICAVCLSMSSQIMIESYNNSINYFVFFSTLSAYNFQRIIRLKKEEENHKLRWLFRYKKIIYFFIPLCVIMSLYFFINFNLKSQISIFIASIISILYPFGLRKIPVFKIIFISIVWTIITSLIFLFENNISINQEQLLHLISRFLFVFAITIPFDIRDMKIDDQKFKTIPILIGEKRSKLVAIYSIILVMVIYLQLFYKNSLSINNLSSIIIILFITSLLILKSHHKKDELYFSLWIESTSIMFYLILRLSSWIV